MARSGWENLMSIKSKNGNCQLFKRFTFITETEMKAAKKSRTSDEYNSSKNLYIATWRLIGSNVKREMNVHMESIGCDGPTFLWYIFKYYHITAVQTVRTTLTKLNNLRWFINDKCWCNIDRFATYIVTLLLRLAENGGKDNQAFEKVYEVLINSPCAIFNSETIAYKQVNSSNLEVSKMFVKAREEYRMLVENKTWSNVSHKKPKHRQDRQKQQPTDIAALVALTDQENEISCLRKDLKSSKQANVALR